MTQGDFEESGLWRLLAQFLSEIDFSIPVEERLRRIGVSFKVHKTPYGDLILFDKPHLGGLNGRELPNIEPSDDLSEIKSSLGLPDDTPEPLVGVIWHLQQRIEDLEKEDSLTRGL